MQEYRVTAGGTTHDLPLPFLVFATQNPVEQEGTYPLPEAQLDRFMMMLKVGYPDADEEAEIVKRTTSAALPTVKKILSPDQILAFQDLVLRVPVADATVALAVRLARATRPSDVTAPGDIKEFVAYGASPRAGQHLIMAAKARAILDGRPAVDAADVRALAPPVLRHRILTNFHAEARKVTPDDLIDKVLASVSNSAP
jgi:MoxR-like ATPase